LYDQVEVIDWLQATNRLDQRPQEVVAVWQLADQLRGDLITEDALPLLLVLLAVMERASSSDWQRIREASQADLDATLRSIAHSLFPFADEVMPRGKLPGAAVTGAIATLSSIDRPQVALMAGALLEQAAQAFDRRGGEYLSPSSVRKLIVAVADPSGTVYNPASGIGQLMVDAAAAAQGTAAISLTGQEINSQVWAMARLNLAIHGVGAELALGDVFGHDSYPQLRADCVITVPPWNQRLPIAESLEGDPRWVWGEPGSNDGNAAWIQHCLYHLSDSGRAAMVLPNGVLFEGGRAGRIRQRIVKAGLLDAVIALPPGLFAWTGLPCAVLVFTKGRPDVDGKPAPTLMVDLSDAAEGQGRRSASLPDDVITGTARLYRDWRSGESPKAKNAAVASFDDLAAHDFIIDPRRYLSVAQSSPNLERATQERRDLVARLGRLTQASREADDQLKAILEVGR
jgi:type I restriction enzyme M protein